MKSDRKWWEMKQLVIGNWPWKWCLSFGHSGCGGWGLCLRAWAEGECTWQLLCWESQLSFGEFLTRSCTLTGFPAVWQHLANSVCTFVPILYFSMLKDPVCLGPVIAQGQENSRDRVMDACTRKRWYFYPTLISIQINTLKQVKGQMSNVSHLGYFKL